jgi:cation diffusion facilitator family transporter
MFNEKCMKCGKRIGLIAIVSSLFLGGFKLVIGITSGSHALIANAFYSMQDVISAIIVFLSTKLAGRKADEKYPYGYGKLEFISSAVISVGIIICVVIVLFLAGRSVFEGPRQPGWLAFWGAAISFLATLILSRYVMCAGKILDSPAMISNAQHIRSDTITSACVAVAIVITKLGFQHLDAVIAIFEAIHIIKTSVEIFHRGVKGLMDSSLPPREIRKIMQAIRQHKEVSKISSIKARPLGRKKQIDCEIELEGDSPLSKAEDLKRKIKASIIEAVHSEALINVGFVPFQPELQETRQKSDRVIKILSNYYRSFIKKHEVQFEGGNVQLGLVFVSEIPAISCRKICNRIQNQIEGELPESKVLVTYKNH